MADAVVGKAVYQTEIDKTGLQEGLSSAAAEISKTGDAVSEAFDGKASESVSRWGGLIHDVAKTAGEELVKIGTGMVFDKALEVFNGLSDSIGLASDKMESASKAQILFGNGFKIIEDASKSAATTVALSSGKYLELAGTLGNLLTNFQLTGEQSADMSKSLIQLAADVASFSNADPAEVVEAMGAAFRGETEPARRFGIMLSADAVNAEALRLGLANSTKEIGPAARAQATYSLILQQTSAAQGDLARTSTGLANQQRLAAAAQEEQWTKIGEILYPIAQKVMPLVQGAILGVVTQVGLIIDGLDQWIQKNEPFIHMLSDGVHWIGDMLGGALATVMGFIGPINDFFGGMPGLITGIGAASIVAVPALGGLVGKLTDLLHLSGPLGKLADVIEGALSTVFSKIASSGPVQAAAAAAGAAATKAYQLGMAGVELVTDAMKVAWVAVSNAVGVVLGGAQAAGTVEGATGGTAIAAMSSRIAAMAIPLAPAGTTVGVAVGAALQAGVILGLVGLAAAVAVALTEQQSSGDVMTTSADLGHAAADRYAAGYSDEIKNNFASVVQRAYIDISKQRHTTQGVLPLAIEQGKQYLQSLGLTITGGLPTVLSNVADSTMNTGAQPWSEAGDNSGEAYISGLEEKGRAEKDRLAGLGKHLAQNVQDGVDGGLQEAQGGLTDDQIAGMFHYDQMLKVGRDLGHAIPGEIGKGMQEEANKVYDAASTLRDILKNGTSPASRAKDFIQNGKDYIKLINQGINSEKDGALETARELAVGAIRTIDQAANGTPDSKGLKAIGEYYAQLLASGLNAQQAHVALQAAGVSQSVIDGIEGKEPALNKTVHDSVVEPIVNPISKINLYSEGQDIIQSLANGMNSKRPVVRSAADGVGRIVTNHLQLDSPAKEGIWSQRGGPQAVVARSANKIVDALVAPVRSRMGEVASVFGQLTAATAGGGRPGILAGMPGILPMPPAFAAGGPSGAHYNMHLHIGTLIADDAGLVRLGHELERVAVHWNRD